MYWPEKMSPTIRALDVRTSFMQRLPLVTRNHQPFLLLYPLAFESFFLGGSHGKLSLLCLGIESSIGPHHPNARADSSTDQGE